MGFLELKVWLDGKNYFPYDCVLIHSQIFRQYFAFKRPALAAKSHSQAFFKASETFFTLSDSYICIIKRSICLKFLLVHISLILCGEYEGWEEIFGKKCSKPIMPSVSFLFFCKESKNNTHSLVGHFLQKLQWHTILSIHRAKHHSWMPASLATVLWVGGGRATWLFG